MKQLPPNALIQLPNDAVSVGYRQTRPFHHEQIFRSESAGFTGTEREFFEAGRAYAYVQLDRYTRLTFNQEAGRLSYEH